MFCHVLSGLFRTSPDGRFYPNPQCHIYMSDLGTALKHFEFLGRMLGKALYDGMLVELPLARFFLSKLLGQRPYLNDLASLDPELHKNLMMLKTYEGDVEDLSLDFSVSTDDTGMTDADDSIVDLIPNGREIPVTNANRIKYLYYMANYRLNLQIDRHCEAFRRGLFDLIDHKWLIMFSPMEMQTLLSGTDSPIDVEDMRQNINYAGAYTDDHPTIQLFWKIVHGMSNTERQELLKFMTSCRLPPLLGFSHMYPKLCIASAGESEERLPTASTCMNLLKLPIFTDEDTMRSKILYAIKSGSGFELS